MVLERQRPAQPPRQEDFSSPERLLPATDCLIILGGGIDEVTTRNVETLEEETIWKPSRYVVGTDASLEARDKRIGTRKPLEKDEQLGGDLVIHGGTAHLLAGIQFLDEMKQHGSLPQRTGFAMGRPDYIDNVTSDLEADEGVVQLREFERRTGPDAFPGMVIEARGEGSKNTAGDLLNGLKAVHDRGLRRAVIILTEARMERTKTICAILKERFPKLAGIETTFISSEDLLRRRYSGSAASAMFEKIQQHLKARPLWEETRKREESGVVDLKKGAYDLRISGVDTSGLQ